MDRRKKGQNGENGTGRSMPTCVLWPWPAAFASSLIGHGAETAGKPLSRPLATHGLRRRRGGDRFFPESVRPARPADVGQRAQADDKKGGHDSLYRRSLK